MLCGNHLKISYWIDLNSRKKLPFCEMQNVIWVGNGVKSKRLLVRGGGDRNEIARQDTTNGTSIGESLFTLFASLTYAYHYLMTLIK